LATASWYGWEDIVQLLLEKGADVNAHGGLYISALQMALSKGHENIAQLLIKNGADVNVQVKLFSYSSKKVLTSMHRLGNTAQCWQQRRGMATRILFGWHLRKGQM
jgi:ankyrin repeat protein